MSAKGRPKKKVEDKFVYRMITLPGDLNEEFAKLCRERNVPVSASIQELMQMRLEGVA